MAKTLQARELRKIMRKMGSYFLEGQVTYKVTINGRNYAAPAFLYNPEEFGVPADEALEIKRTCTAEKYMVDFIYENASKIEEFYIILREQSLKNAIEGIVKREGPSCAANTDKPYWVVVTPSDDAVEAVEAPKATPVKSVAPIIPKADGKAAFMHFGIPVTNKKPGMVYLDHLKVWVGNPSENDLHVEYVKYEEGTPFPEIIHRNTHICYWVEDMQEFIGQADQVLYGPTAKDGNTDCCFIMKDGAVVELQAPHK